MKKEKTKAEEWLQRRAWKKFLLAIPVGKTRGYLFQSANDLNTIRVHATQLNTDDNCCVKFSVAIDYDSKVATITSTLK